MSRPCTLCPLERCVYSGDKLEYELEHQHRGREEQHNESLSTGEHRATAVTHNIPPLK